MMEWHKMSSDQLEEFIDGGEGTMDDAWRASHELEIRKVAAIQLYKALVGALPYLDGKVMANARAAIAMIEDQPFVHPMTGAVEGRANSKKPKLVKID